MINGRHLVFIVGFITAAIVSRWNTDIAKYIIDLLFVIGIGLFVIKMFR